MTGVEGKDFRFRVLEIRGKQPAPEGFSDLVLALENPQVGPTRIADAFLEIRWGPESWNVSIAKMCGQEILTRLLPQKGVTESSEHVLVSFLKKSEDIELVRAALNMGMAVYFNNQDQQPYSFFPQEEALKSIDKSTAGPDRVSAAMDLYIALFSSRPVTQATTKA